jgi:hypothetical protein
MAITVEAVYVNGALKLDQPLPLSEHARVRLTIDPISGPVVQPPSPIDPSPDLKDWARRQFSEQEIVAGLQELREKGGIELSEFLPELEQAAGLDG